jgi:hypothetical protein
MLWKSYVPKPISADVDVHPQHRDADYDAVGWAPPQSANGGRTLLGNIHAPLIDRPPGPPA